MGDGDEDGGGCGSGLVLEADGVGEDLRGGEPVLVAETGWTDDVVGVAGNDYGGLRACLWLS